MRQPLSGHCGRAGLVAALAVVALLLLGPGRDGRRELRDRTSLPARRLDDADARRRQPLRQSGRMRVRRRQGRHTGCVHRLLLPDSTAPSNFSSSSLDTVATAAAAGDTIDVQGTCIGSSMLPRSLTVDGVAAPGYSAPTLQGTAGPQPSGVLTVAAGATVTVDSLTITGGQTFAKGAGIDNNGALTLDGPFVMGNRGAPGPGSAPGLGSGIRNDGTLVLHGTTVSHNGDNQVGAGIMNETGAVTLDDSTVEDNSTPGDGGGIENLGSAVLDGTTTVTGNSAFTGGGIDYTFASDATLTLNDTSSVTGNSARFGGGINNVANGLATTASVTLNDSSRVSGNTAESTSGFPGGFGGGIFNEANSGGTATVTLDGASTVSGNTAVPTGAVGGLGGGIDNLPESASSTTTVIMNGSSTITGNAALHGGGIFDNPGGLLVNCNAGANVFGNTPDDIA